jgi:hypothetical protein
MIQCVRCGTQLPAGTQICTRCGSQQPAASVHEQPTVIGTPPGLPQGQPAPYGSQPPAYWQQSPGYGQPPPSFGQPQQPGAWQGPPVQSFGAPTPPKKSKLPLILGGIGGFLLLCCVGLVALTVVVSRFGGGSGTMEFGTDYTQASGDLEIVGKKASFTQGEQLAFVADLSGRANASGLDLIMVRVNSDGTEEEVFNTEVAISDPDSRVIAYKNPVLLALTGGEAGSYKIKLMRDSTVLSEGSFTYQ